MKTVINTRHDLDSIAGTPEHAAFIAALKGSLTRTTDVRVYPDGYDHNLKPEDAGYLAPTLGPINDDSSALRFGFAREELLAL